MQRIMALPAVGFRKSKLKYKAALGAERLKTLCVGSKGSITHTKRIPVIDLEIHDLVLI